MEIEILLEKFFVITKYCPISNSNETHRYEQYRIKY